MTTRQTIPDDPLNPVDHLPTGYDPNTNSPTDFTVPSCGIEDVDVALFNLFNQELGFVQRQVPGETGPIMIKKPVVIFATGERFAIVKSLRPIRDQNKALMLPSISIRRTSVEQTAEDSSGRGMNQTTGELVVKRRLDSSDRDYQAFLNKMRFMNVVTPPSSSRDNQGELLTEPAIAQGALLEPHYGNNVFEIITIPQPQFFTASYDVIFWTSYTSHMNYMIETLFSSFLPQGKMFKITSPKGYWFIAYVDDTFSSQDNVEDFTDEKRIIRYSFTVKVKGYILAVNGPGNMVPVRRHLSAPRIVFDMVNVQNDVPQRASNMEKWTKDSKFALSEINPDGSKTQTPTSLERFLTKKEVINPVTGKTTTRYVKATDQAQVAGETVYTASDLQTLAQFLFPNKK